MNIFTKFHEDWTKIVNFLLMAMCCFRPFSFFLAYPVEALKAPRYKYPGYPSGSAGPDPTMQDAKITAPRALLH